MNVVGFNPGIDFRLSAKRDKAAARRFFRRALGRETTRNPQVIGICCIARKYHNM